MAVILEETPWDEPAGEHIRAGDVYFEPIPIRLINGRVDEQGLNPWVTTLPRDHPLRKVGHLHHASLKGSLSRSWRFIIL